MKRLFLLILIIMLPPLCFAGDLGLLTKSVFNEGLVASTAETSEIIEVNKIFATGFWGLQVDLNDNDGSVTIEWLVSNDGTNFREALNPDGTRWSNICTAFAFNDGESVDGLEMFTVQPPPFKYLRLRITPSAHNIFNLNIIVSYTCDSRRQ